MACRVEYMILTRFQSTPFDNCLCFFCQPHSCIDILCTNLQQKIPPVEYYMMLSKKWGLCVKRSSAIYPKDAHAIDIRYHMHCWAKHVHVSGMTKFSDINPADEIASNIEILGLVHNVLGTEVITDIFHYRMYT